MATPASIISSQGQPNPPPSHPPDQRFYSQPRDEEPPVRKHMCVIASSLVLAAIVLALSFWGFSLLFWSPERRPRSSDDIAAILSFLNSITLSGQTLRYKNSAEIATSTAEEKAVHWLIETDLDTDVNDQRALRQRYVLATVWFQNGPTWKSTRDSSALAKRLAANNECNWQNIRFGIDWLDVSCDGHGTVSSIVSSSKRKDGLKGPIPADLGLLTSLTRLSLEGFQSTGTIPSSLGFLTRLSGLNLEDNQLNGTIPMEIGGLTSLYTLFLSANELTGTIPASLGFLTNLYSLHLGGNQLNGTIPMEIGGLTRLYTLILSANELAGTIPSSLGFLTGLSELNLEDNQLHGTIPMEIGGLTMLNTLILSANALTGTIPTWLGSLAALVTLTMNSNQLTGSIPSVLGSLMGLVWLSLNSNQLTGTIPPFLKTSYWVVSLYNNNLTGSVPSCAGPQKYIELEADCSEVFCPCCTTCCPGGNTSRPGRKRAPCEAR
jgi:Leucine rich repeat